MTDGDPYIDDLTGSRPVSGLTSVDFADLQGIHFQNLLPGRAQAGCNDHNKLLSTEMRNKCIEIGLSGNQFASQHNLTDPYSGSLKFG